MNSKVDLDSTKVPTLIISCLVLQNYCESDSVCLDEDFERVYLKKNREDAENFSNIPDPVYSGTTVDGQYIRDLLTSYVSHNLPNQYYLKIQVLTMWRLGGSG